MSAKKKFISNCQIYFKSYGHWVLCMDGKRVTTTDSMLVDSIRAIKNDDMYSACMGVDETYKSLKCEFH